MNERIKNLAIQSGITRILNEHAHEYGNGMFENTPYPELEKFAELIVRECANVAADHDALDIYEEIREHFGVEE